MNKYRKLESNLQVVHFSFGMKDHNFGDICHKCGKSHGNPPMLGRHGWLRGHTRGSNGLCIKCGVFHNVWKGKGGRIPWNKGKKGMMIGGNKGHKRGSDGSCIICHIVHGGWNISGHMRGDHTGGLCIKCGKVHGFGNKKGHIPWNKGKTGLQSPSMKGHKIDSEGKCLKCDKIHGWGWNKGLTKETDIRIALQAEKMIGHIPTYPKPRYIPELGHIVRSSWEEAVARKLKEYKLFYSYEPVCFKIVVKGKSTTYRPDFRLINGTFIEVKGFLSNVSREKINAFMKQWPSERLVVIGNLADSPTLNCPVVAYGDWMSLEKYFPMWIKYLSSQVINKK